MNNQLPSRQFATTSNRKAIFLPCSRKSRPRQKQSGSRNPRAAKQLSLDARSVSIDRPDSHAMRASTARKFRLVGSGHAHIPPMIFRRIGFGTRGSMFQNLPCFLQQQNGPLRGLDTHHAYVQFSRSPLRSQPRASASPLCRFRA